MSDQELDATTTGPVPLSARETSSLRGSGIVPLVLQIASAAFWFLAFVYVFGWIRANAYYREIGAPWLVSRLNQVEFLSLAASPIKTMLLSAVLAIQYLSTTPAKWDRTYLVAVGVSLVAVLMSIGSMLASSGRHYMISSTLSGLSSMLWGLGLSAWIAGVIQLLRHGSARFAALLFYSFCFLFLFGLGAIPSEIGRQDGSRDRDPDRTLLPSVSMSQSPDSCLYLLRSDNETLFLMSLRSGSSAPTFRVVHADVTMSVSAVGGRFQRTKRKAVTGNGQATP